MFPNCKALSNAWYDPWDVVSKKRKIYKDNNYIISWVQDGVYFV